MQGTYVKFEIQIGKKKTSVVFMKWHYNIDWS